MPGRVVLAGRVVATLALVVSVVACGDDDDTGSSSATLTSIVGSGQTTTAVDGGVVPTSAVPTSVVGGVAPSGFDTTAATIVAAGGEQCLVCVWLADTDSERRRGLMGVTDLDGAAGMVFLFEQPRTGAFTMRNTLMPLSIAFFSAEGDYVDAFDMEPCAAEPCPSYPTPENVTVAFEVPQGGLAELGVGPGAVLALGAPDATAVCEGVGSSR